MDLTFDEGNITTGAPSQAISTLRRRISAFTRDGTPFKIGITSDPYRRKSQYEDDTDYDEMIVLYRTSSDRYQRQLEQTLIDDYWDECDNSIQGGGGRPASGPSYYLYIVIEW